MPRAARALRRQPRDVSPSNSTRPRVGVSEPAMRLNSVVLPAPLGPIRPVIPPPGSVRLTPSTAREAAKTLGQHFRAQAAARSCRASRRHLRRSRARQALQPVARDRDGQRSAARHRARDRPRQARRRRLRAVRRAHAAPARRPAARTPCRARRRSAPASASIEIPGPKAIEASTNRKYCA